MKKKIIAMLLGLAAVVAQGSQIQELYSWDTVHAGTGNMYYAHVFDGQYSYHAFSSGGACMTWVNNETGESGVLFNSTDWQLASGGTSTLNVFYGLGVSGDYLLWTDSGTDSVWKADKATGQITQVVSNSLIADYTGVSAATGACFTVAPNGGLTFYDSGSDSFLNAALDGSISTVISASDLDIYAGDSANVRNGLTYDTAGSLYWANSSTDSIYSLQTDGTISTVLSMSEITAVTGSATAYVNDMFFGEDGNIYFYDSVSGDILSFATTDGVSTLEIFLSAAELDASDINRAVTLGWYNDGSTDYLTFHEYNGSGLWAAEVPEPATILLISGGTLAMLRRKKRC